MHNNVIAERVCARFDGEPLGSVDARSCRTETSHHANRAKSILQLCMKRSTNVFVLTSALLCFSQLPLKVNDVLMKRQLPGLVLRAEMQVAPINKAALKQKPIDLTL